MINVTGAKGFCPRVIHMNKILNKTIDLTVNVVYWSSVIAMVYVCTVMYYNSNNSSKETND